MSGIRAEIASLPLGDTAMDYVRFGQGGRALVILPGLSLRGLRGTEHAMARMYRLLAQERTVYILDRKDKVPQPCTIQALAADTAQAMDALDIRGADVMGISMGGMIAQYLALDRPDLVGKLVLAVTMSRPNDTLRRVSARWQELAARDDYDGLVRDVMESMYSDGFLERFGRILPLVAQHDRPALDRFRILEEACLTCAAYERLEEIRCPVLVIGGRKDKIVTGRASEEIAEKLGCALYMYEDLGHSAYEEARDFNARVLAFFLAP